MEDARAVHDVEVVVEDDVEPLLQSWREESRRKNVGEGTMISDDLDAATPDVGVELAKAVDDTIQLLLVGRVSLLRARELLARDSDDVGGGDVLVWTRRLEENTTNTNVGGIGGDAEGDGEVGKLEEWGGRDGLLDGGERGLERVVPHNGALKLHGLEGGSDLTNVTSVEANVGDETEETLHGITGERTRPVEDGLHLRWVVADAVHGHHIAQALHTRVADADRRGLDAHVDGGAAVHDE